MGMPLFIGKILTEMRENMRESGRIRPKSSHYETWLAKKRRNVIDKAKSWKLGLKTRVTIKGENKSSR